MYNLYTYEKEILENRKKQKEDLNKKEYRKKRKKELNKLSKNYENRIKDFIYSMCEKPIIFYRNSMPNDNNKAISNEIFKLGEYKTVKQRLELIEENEKILRAYAEKRKKTERNRNILKIKNQRNLVLIQPEMKFMSKLKLDKIADKNRKHDNNKNSLLKSSCYEQNKELQNNRVKKIKAFYNSIDKDLLKDNEILNIIGEMNEVEQWESNNHYNIKKYLDWKYNKKVSYNNDSKEKESKNENNRNAVLKNIGNDNNKIKEKKHFKSYFKGLSQFMELMEPNDEKDNKFKSSNQKNKRVMSSLRLQSTILKNMNNKNSHNSRNLKYFRLNEMKRPISSMNLYNNLDKRNILLNKIYKKEYNLKELNNDFKEKKLIMLESMDEEINKSISKNFMKKYNSITYFDNSYNVYVPEDVILKNLRSHKRVKMDNNFKEKFELLSDELEREEKQIHNEKYKLFVKKFAKNIFGFKGKEIRKEIDEIKTSNPFDNIVLDGKIYQKKDIRTLGNLILRKSNFYNKKKLNK